MQVVGLSNIGYSMAKGKGPDMDATFKYQIVHRKQVWRKIRSSLSLSRNHHDATSSRPLAGNPWQVALGRLQPAEAKGGRLLLLIRSRPALRRASTLTGQGRSVKDGVTGGHLSKNALIGFQYLVGASHSQAMFDPVVIFGLVYSQLLFAILVWKHSQIIIESLLVNPIGTLHLSVVSGCSRLDSVVYDSTLFHQPLKFSLCLFISRQQLFGKLRSVIRLDHPYLKWSFLQKLLQKLLWTVGTVLVVHLAVGPSCALIHSYIYVVFLLLCCACQAVSWNIFNINLDFLTRICCPFVWLIPVLLLFLQRFGILQFSFPLLKTMIAACEAMLLNCFLVCKDCIAPLVFLAQPPNKPDLLFCHFLRHPVRSTASVFQACFLSVPYFMPFIKRFSWYPVTFACLHYVSVFCIIFQVYLTVMGFLRYTHPGPPVMLLFLVEHILSHRGLFDCTHCVTYVLYQKLLLKPPLKKFKLALSNQKELATWISNIKRWRAVKTMAGMNAEKSIFNHLMDVMERVDKLEA